MKYLIHFAVSLLQTAAEQIRKHYF